MLENRSLDNVLGYLYEHGEETKTIGEVPDNFQENVFEGLHTGEYFNEKTPGGEKVFVSRIIRREKDFQVIPSVDPHEEFSYVMDQIAPSDKTPMAGFLSNFSTVSGAIPEQIMKCYSPNSLPIINWLAKNFAVSDAYFSSIPSQTNSNRAFSITGNSIGYWSHLSNNEKGARVNNEWSTDLTGNDGFDPFQFTEPTFFSLMPDKDWRIYYSHLWPDATVTIPIWGRKEFYPGNFAFTQDLFTDLTHKPKDNFQPLAQFYSDLENGSLPKVSYVEPAWLTNGTKDYFKISGHNGTSYHPPADVAPGEQFLFELYNKLIKSPKWEETLLIINFDEHGGTYDHITPGTATAPWEGNDGTPVPTHKENEFNFKQFGVRVPLILVSPWIDEKVVIRSPDKNYPFDHTSVIASILEWLGISRESWQLGSRTVKAKTFWEALNLSKARTNIPVMPPPLPNQSENMEFPPSDLQLMIAKRILSKSRRNLNYPQDKFQKLMNEHFKDFKTAKDMNNATQHILDLIAKKSDSNIGFSLESTLNNLGLAYNETLFNAIKKYLGPSIYDKDASLVACSDPKELNWIKTNFLISKLGMKESPTLDNLIHEVCASLGKSNRHKNRIVFYYLLVVRLEKESVFI